jgi:hypothetical protein
MIELNRILGANYFSFYSYNISDQTNKVLNYYKDLGVVDNIEWDMPIPATKIHYYGQSCSVLSYVLTHEHYHKVRKGGLYTL